MLEEQVVKYAVNALLLKVREIYDDYLFVRLSLLTDGSGSIEDATTDKRLFTFHSVAELMNHLETIGDSNG